jgi:hypothetical protein
MVNIRPFDNTCLFLVQYFACEISEEAQLVHVSSSEGPTIRVSAYTTLWVRGGIPSHQPTNCALGALLLFGNLTRSNILTHSTLITNAPSRSPTRNTPPYIKRSGAVSRARLRPPPHDSELSSEPLPENVSRVARQKWCL